MADKPTYEELEQKVKELEKEVYRCKQVEKAVWESEEKFKAIAGSAKDAITIMNNEGNISYWNEAAEKTFGYSAHEALGKELHIFLAPPKYHDAYTRAIVKFRTTGQGPVVGKTLELEAVRKDGTIFPMELSVSAVKIEEKWNALGIVRDISLRKEAEEALERAHNELEQRVEERTTDLRVANEKLQGEISERKRAEEALRESGDLMRQVFNTTPNCIFAKDRDGKFILVNKPMAELYGTTPEAMVGKTEYDFLKRSKAASKEIEKFLADDREVIDSKKTKFIPLEKFTREGIEWWFQTTKLPLVLRGNPNCVLGVAVDITERVQAEEEKKKLEAKFQQAQKLEAIGTLAGGIAHDFNNILSAIIGYTEIASLRVPEGSKVKNSLKGVLQASGRAKDLVNQILSFSRQREQEPKPVQISSIIKEALKLLRASLPTTIEIHQNIESYGVVEADPSQIHQVLINLCTNAAHAIGQNEGLLEVSLTEIDINETVTAKFPDMHPGPYLKLSVRDTGQGIKPEILPRIFDPYFTTKEKGLGTGLGLAVVHGIVTSCGGTITAESEPGEGTTFYVYLPRVEHANEGEATESVEPLATGHECILFIDDEQTLVDIGRQTLENLGYHVVTETSSIKALELFREQPDEFDLVITDQTMPHMTGERLAEQIMEIRPDIPVILCTGFSSRITEERAKAMGIREFLMKPLVMRHLTKAVRKVLDNK
jgi:two-component system cell cycle sensor histidine kinase/response regulator CckA